MKCLSSLVPALILGCVFLFIPAGNAVAAGISVNFRIGTNDAQSVDAEETATQLMPTTGTNWNNVRLSDSSSSASIFVANSTGGNFILLHDDLGRSNAAQLTSTFPVGGGNSQFSGITASEIIDVEGEAGLMASYLLLGGNFPAETLVMSGLDSTFTSNGYKACLFFDIGTVLSNSRTLGYSVNDGVSSNVYWAVDSAGDNSDTDDDGVMEWLQATGNKQADATIGANYAVFEGLSGSNFTISVTGAYRGSICGLQIVANEGPPPVVESFTATPGAILPGETATLAWQVSGADSVSIAPDIGTVPASGTTNVTPASSTTYTLIASNAFSTLTTTVTVTINMGPVDVYLLGGQSNMQGKGDVNSIPAGEETVPGMLYYHSSTVKGITLPDTLYTNVTATGVSSGQFGPEIGFANRIKQLRPDVGMALIKYAVGGTDLADDWRPGTDAADNVNWGPQFSGFVNTVNGGLAALRYAGYQPHIVGMLWQQGEADARTEVSSLLYESNLVHFIARVREQFSADIPPDGMRFVQGTVLPYAPPGGTAEISYPGRQTVNTTKFNVDENSGSSAAVSNVSTVYCDEIVTPTKEQILNDGDEVHLAAQGQLMLGKLMAEQMKAPDFSSWSVSNSLVNGSAGDDDGDGLLNGLEFFLGTNPQFPDSRSAAPGSLLASLDTGDGLKNYFVMSFRQDMLHNAAGFSWLVDGAANLTDWAGSVYEPVLVDRVNHSDGTATFRYRTARPIDEDPQNFLRLRLTISSP